MLPRLGSSALVTRWIAITLLLSIIAGFDGGWIADHFSLEPSEIWRGQVWRLVTWPLVEAGPTSLILTCVAIYRFGSDLSQSWGDRRLLRFSIEIVALAGVVTCLLALVSNVYVERLGGWAITDALTIAWARQFPDRGLTLYYGMVTLSGRNLIAITLGTTILYAISSHPIAVAPELVACIVAVAYPRWLLQR